MGRRRRECSLTPIERLRVEKAAADSGFEMTPMAFGDGLQLRSVKFPESVLVRSLEAGGYEVSLSDPSLLDLVAGAPPLHADDIVMLYELLQKVAARARTRPNRVANEFKLKTAAMPRSTEAERLVVQRVGQGLFRSALQDFWQGRCCVTGLEIQQLLRASHIRPWALCDSDEQRLDVFNGLLLAPHVDALFDGGWISFKDSGDLMLSPKLHGAAKESLGVDGAWHVAGLTSRHLPYLAYHRENVLQA